jgi:glucokinase
MLLNDLQAAALGLAALGPDDVCHITGPIADGSAPAAVMGVGTGLGQATIVRGEVVPGEGGHADFAPSDSELSELLAWIRKTEHRAHVPVDAVVSGAGLSRMFRFALTRHAVSPLVQAASSDGVSPAALVSGYHHSDPACDLAASLWTRALAAECRAAALRVLARGGVWICGGVAPRLQSRIQSAAFVAHFLGTGPMHDVLKQVPVLLVTHPHLNLLGAARAMLGAKHAP